MRLPAMITAITAEVGRRGRSRTAVCVQHGELPRPAPCGSYSTISENRTGLSTRARDDSAAAVDSIPPGAGLARQRQRRAPSTKKAPRLRAGLVGVCVEQAKGGIENDNRYLRMLFMQAARVILLRPANWA
jgi:hypothetical protein